MNKVANNPYLSRAVPLRLPRVCVAVVGSDPAEMLARAQAALRSSPFLEFRLDHLKHPATFVDKFRDFIEIHSEAVFIATCRRGPNGGCFRGSVAAQLQVLLKAAATGFQIVDLEVESAQELDPAEVAKLRAAARLLLSYHDFHGTGNLDEVFRGMEAIPADYYKLATTATGLQDNVAMIRFLEQKSRTHAVVGLCMGEQGMASRILGLRAGSLFTFASAIAGEETAAGQVTAQALCEIYRIEQIDRATRVYGVAGDPVAHSLSPIMLNAAFQRENVNAVYLPLLVKNLDDLLAFARALPISGFSVTMPYKERIIPHLANTDALTRTTGACNTVVRGQNNLLFGFNTDVGGVIAPLEQRLSLSGANVLVLGAGGAARAAVYGLKERGVNVHIVNRTAAHGQKLAKQSGANYLKRTDLKKREFDVIVNATPVGMDSDESPLAEKEIHSRFGFDMVYASRETPFTRAARAAGAEIILGVEMFVHQGARQFEIWTGKPAPVQEMMNVVQRTLAERS